MRWRLSCEIGWLNHQRRGTYEPSERLLPDGVAAQVLTTSRRGYVADGVPTCIALVGRVVPDLASGQLDRTEPALVDLWQAGLAVAADVLAVTLHEVQWALLERVAKSRVWLGSPLA